MANQKSAFIGFKILTLDCSNYLVTQKVVAEARYNGELLFVEWPKNRVQIAQKVSAWDKTDALITNVKNQKLGLEQIA